MRIRSLKKILAVILCLSIYSVAALYRLGYYYGELSSIDFIYIFYNIIPGGDMFNIDEFFMFICPFLGLIALTSYYISKYILSIKWMVMIRSQQRIKWYMKNIRNIMIIQVVCILGFNVLFYLISNILWQSNTVYLEQGNAIVMDLLGLILRQIGCFCFFGALQLYVSIKINQVIASLITAILLILNAFIIKMHLFTPLAIAFSEEILHNTVYNVSLIIFVFILAFITIALTCSRIRKKDFI